ncbi:MAG: RNA polymerase sigma factor [Anaerolineae bacterium]
MSEPNELTIIRQARLGNKNALATLYQMHKVAIYTYVFYRVEGDSAVADDLTAEVFGRMVAKIHTFQPNGNPLLAWLYTIARNLISDHYREEKQNEKQLDDSLNHDNSIFVNQDPELSVQLTIDTQRLLQALNKITAEQQELVILRFIEGRTVAETAGIMGKQPGAVKTMSRRALASLQRIMEQEGYQHV